MVLFVQNVQRLIVFSVFRMIRVIIAKKISAYLRAYKILQFNVFRNAHTDILQTEHIVM
jgi:hypothetical protein